MISAGTTAFDLVAGFDLPGLKGWSLVNSSVEPRMLCSDPQILTSAEHDSTIQVMACSTGAFLLEFPIEISIHVSMDAKRVSIARESAEATEETYWHLLADQVAPRILSQQGQLVLHAGAVSIDDKAVLFLGVSGRGKSSLVAHFIVQGSGLLGDDAIIVTIAQGIVAAKAVYPTLRLHPNTINNIFKESPVSQPVSQFTEKRRLVLDRKTTNLVDEIPLRALFFIGPETVDDEISIRQMSPAEVCMGLVENSFWLDPEDRQLAGIKLKQAGEIAGQIPGYELSYSRRFDQLSKVEGAIRSQLGLTEKSAMPFTSANRG